MKNKFYVDIDSVNMRIDKYLTDNLEDVSRSNVQKLIDDGNALVNGKKVKRNYKLKENDIVEIEIPEPQKVEIKAQDIDIDIVYEDEDVVVINKGKDMVVHPAPGNYEGTLVNAILYHCKDLSGINGELRPGIVHRIDKDTTGLILVCKNDYAHNFLAEQFKEHSIERAYYALAEGVIKENKGRIEAPIGRHPIDRKKMAVVTKNSKDAITNYEVKERFKNHSLIECVLETGRTHQIRVHLSYIHHPIVGDLVYGSKKNKFGVKSQMLHAYKLGFVHPRTKEDMLFEIGLPEYFEKILKRLRGEMR